MELVKKVKEKMKHHSVVSMALIAESTPVYVLFEKCNPIAPMSDDMSINARLLATGLAFSGLAFVYSKGRDLSKNFFKITNQTLEKIKVAHDIAYNTVFSLAVSPPIYAVSQALAGEDLDLTKIAVGTSIAVGIGAVNGAPQGYAVDMFKDFTGIGKNNRVPNSLESLAKTFDETSFITPATDYLADKIRSFAESTRKLKSRTKKSILVGLVASSIGITGLIYTLTPENNPKVNYQTQSTIEQKINTD